MVLPAGNFPIAKGCRRSPGTCSEHTLVAPGIVLSSMGEDPGTASQGLKVKLPREQLALEGHLVAY